MAKRELPIEKLKRAQEKMQHGVPSGFRGVSPDAIDTVIKKMCSQSSPEGWSQLYEERKNIFKHLLNKMKDSGKNGFSPWA